MDEKQVRNLIARLQNLFERGEIDREKDGLIEEIKNLLGDEDHFTDRQLHLLSDDLLFGRIPLEQATMMDLKTPGLRARVRADGFIEFFSQKKRPFGPGSF